LKTMKNIATLGLLPGLMVLATGLAHATTIPATITTTLTITTDSHLTTNVRCAVPTGTTCIKFGAPGITLKLNGFIMTGNAAPFVCSGNTAENGIDTNLQNNVTIQGPGLVTLFNGGGILVSGNNSSVEGAATSFMCGSGINVLGSKNEVEGNSLSASSVLTGAGGIIVAGSGGHRILNNEVGGIFSGIVVSAINNLIQENHVTGNDANNTASTAGILFASGATGNTVRRNQALGNLLNDIFDANALPGNTYDHNLCQFSNLSVCTPPLPNIAGHENFEPNQNQD
jgi:hypothetical protein